MDISFSSASASASSSSSSSAVLNNLDNSFEFDFAMCHYSCYLYRD